MARFGEPTLQNPIIPKNKPKDLALPTIKPHQQYKYIYIYSNYDSMQYIL